VEPGALDGSRHASGHGHVSAYSHPSFNAQCTMLNAQRTMLRESTLVSERSSPPGARCQDVKMRRPLVLSIVHWALCVVLVSPSPAAAWGFEAISSSWIARSRSCPPTSVRSSSGTGRCVERLIDPDTRIIVGRFDEGGAAPLPRHRRTEATRSASCLATTRRRSRSSASAGCSGMAHAAVAGSGAFRPPRGWRSTPCVNAVA
jgi:hypothetical protein